MGVLEIERQALALSERDRASLAAKLLETLPPPDLGVSDEDVDERERQLDSGEVKAITHEQFVQGVARERKG